MKTLIAVPCMDMMHTQFVHSLLSLRMTDEYEVRFGASSLIYDTRNSLIKYAVNGDFDRVLWFDSDMTFGPEALEYLNEDISKGFEIVSGLYFRRKPPYTPVLFSKCEIVHLGNGLIDPVYEPYNEYPEQSIFEIAACGFGCVMMDMKAVKQLIKKYGMMLFMPVAGFGEDLSFCIRARSAGLRIWCDSRVKLGHVGEMVFNEEYYRGLNNGSDRQGQNGTQDQDIRI